MCLIGNRADFLPARQEKTHFEGGGEKILRPDLHGEEARSKCGKKGPRLWSLMAVAANCAVCVRKRRIRLEEFEVAYRFCYVKSKSSRKSDWQGWEGKLPEALVCGARPAGWVRNGKGYVPRSQGHL